MTAAEAHPGTARPSLDRVWAAVDAAGRQPERTGDLLRARCPLHEDRTPSLSVTWNRDRGGMSRLTCGSCGGSEQDLLEAVGLTLVDRFDQPLPPRAGSSGGAAKATVAPQGNRLGPLPKRLTVDLDTRPDQAPTSVSPAQLTGTYDYLEANGALLYEVLRYERATAAGTQEAFEHRRPDGDQGWRTGVGDRRVLRHLPALTQAIADDRPVWLAAGEHDEEALNGSVLTAGLGVATTEATGTGGFGQLAEQLLGARVRVVVGWDPDGYRRATELVDKLSGVAASVQIFLPAVTEPGAGLAAHLAAGFGVEHFLGLSDEQVAGLGEYAAAHDAARRADQQVARTQVCLDEARARLAAADEAARRGAPVARSDEQRYALRWAHEAVKTVQRATEAAEQVWKSGRAAQQVLVPVELDTAVLLGRAEQAQRTAQRLAGEAWDAVPAAQPAPVQEALSAPTPSERHPNVDPGVLAPTPLPTPAPGSVERADGRPADVVPFPTPAERRTGERTMIAAVRPDFQRIAGQGLFERRTNRDGHEVLHQVLDLDVQIVRIEQIQIDPGTVDRDGVPFLAPQSTLSYLIEWTHPLTAELMRQRIEGDRAASCEWLADLGAMAQYDSSSRGRARVWDAIRATSKFAEVATVYESTGWVDLPEVGWTYVHASGGITQHGVTPLTVRLPRSIDKVDLPAPVADPVEIRRMFDQCSRAMMTRLPARVGAVLLGTAFRAPLGMTKSSTALFGLPGSLKSAVAALTTHHFGVRWERSGAAAMSGQGATVNALPVLWWHAKDALFFGDDFAPDKSVEAAGQHLSVVARMQYNETVRDRFNGRARGGRGGVQQGCSTRTTLLLTSEVRAFADSGDQRLNVVDLVHGDVQLSEVIALDEADSRMGRATVMASLLRWMAGRYPELIPQAKIRAGLAAERRRKAGAPVRVAEPAGELEAGWELVGDWLVDIGAYTAQERDQMLEQVRAALTESGDRSRDPDAPTNVGERVRRLLDTCLRTGTAHVTRVGGLIPADPDALRLGWRRTWSTSDSGEAVPAGLERRGEHIGVVTRTVHGERLHLDPEATMGVILAAARKTGETLAGNRSIVQRELAAIGVLRTEQDKTGTRYTVPVPDPSGAGGQVRCWDLDMTRVFHEKEDAAPAAPSVVAAAPTPIPPVPASTTAPTATATAGPVGPPTYRADQPSAPEAADPVTATPPPAADTAGPELMDEHTMGVAEDLDVLWEHTEHHAIEAVPCVICTRPAAMSIAGDPVHYLCWKQRWLASRAAEGQGPVERVGTPNAPQPVTAAQDGPGTAPAAAPAPSTRPSTATAVSAAASRPAQPRPAVRAAAPAAADRASAWKRAAVVIDADVVYLPDGRAEYPLDLTGLDAIGAIGDYFAVGHPAGPGLVVLTQAALDKLGLMPSAQLLTDPESDGTAADEDIVRARIMAHLADQQATLASHDGWALAGSLAPWTTMRRQDRALRLVLEPFVWMWDPRADSPSPFIALPDPEQDPAECWTELARRLDRLADLLGTPWSTSAGTTGAAVFDQVQRRRSRRNGRVLDRAGVLPELTRTGQVLLEGEADWPAKPHDRSGRPIRPVSRAELDAAAAVHSYDRRGSYLAPAGGTDLPIGDPEELDSEQTQQLLTQVYGAGGGKLPAGLWQITLPAWDEAMPPPHPDQHRFEPRERWVSSPTLRLLLEEQDAGGVGYGVDDLQVQSAWIWPEQSRLLEPWYRQLRDGLLAARTQGDYAVARAIKGVYTGYIGRMESELTAKGSRPWHHQPVWRAFIIAAARSGLWRVMRKHQLATGRIPIAVHIDEVTYLDDDTDATVHAPAPDTGQLGKLKISGSRVLTDHARAALAAGGRVSDERVWVAPDEPGMH